MNREQPQAPEVERVVLASMLLDQDSCARVLDRGGPHLFYSTANRLIYEAIGALVGAGSPAGVVEVADYLERHAQLTRAGGTVYLSELLQSASATTDSIDYYLGILKDKSTARRLITICEQTIASCYSSDDVDKTLRRAEKGIYGATDAVVGQELEPIETAVSRASEELDRIYSEGSVGIPAGLAKLDRYTGGLLPGDLIIVAGRPSMGKTSLCLSMALSAAKAGHKVAIFSLEMSKSQLVQRMIAMEGQVNLFRLRTGQLQAHRHADVSTTMGKLADLPIHIDDSTDISSLGIRSKCRCVRGLGLVVVDYLQLMEGEGKSLREQVGNNTRALKKLAKGLEIPVVLLSQLSRANEAMGSVRTPRLSDLKESGNIEQDADVVLFAHRPEMYKKTDENKGVAEIIIGKQRNGPAGIAVDVGFKREYALFHDEGMTFRQDEEPDEW